MQERPAAPKPTATPSQPTETTAAPGDTARPDPFKAVGRIVGPYAAEQVKPGQHNPNVAPHTRNQPVDGESDQETAGNQNPGHQP